MSQRANQQTRSHSKSSTEPAQGATTSEEPRGAAKEARTSLMKKASALFFGVGLNQRTPSVNVRRRLAVRSVPAAAPQPSRAVKKADTMPPWRLICSPVVAS